MVWNQQEIRAHTGDEEENLPPLPPAPTTLTHVPRLQTSSVLTDPENTNIIWIIRNNFILGIFTLQDFILLS